MTNNLEYENLLFSVLMANYNNARYIEEAINSVLTQTYSNWELIIVDDNSTDKSVKIVDKFLSDDRIKLIQHKINKGYGASLKTAIDNSSNEIITILDADDKLHHEALEIISKVYRENPDYGFIYSTMWECNSQLKNCIRNKWIGLVVPKKSNIFNIKISHLKSFRKESYLKTPGFDPKQRRAVDKDIIFKLEEVADFKFVDIPLYYYRWHGKGISQRKSSFIPEFYHYLAKLKAYRRRLNTDIPNFTKKQIYFEYYRITFFKMTHFFIKLYRKLKIRDLVNKFLEKYYKIPESIRTKLKFLKKIN
jgi:glycosyltransferase involved in cell wall biosynthesis